MADASERTKNAAVLATIWCCLSVAGSVRSEVNVERGLRLQGTLFWMLTKNTKKYSSSRAPSLKFWANPRLYDALLWVSSHRARNDKCPNELGWPINLRHRMKNEKLQELSQLLSKTSWENRCIGMKDCAMLQLYSMGSIASASHARLIMIHIDYRCVVPQRRQRCRFQNR